MKKILYFCLTSLFVFGFSQVAFAFAPFDGSTSINQSCNANNNINDCYFYIASPNGGIDYQVYDGSIVYSINQNNDPNSTVTVEACFGQLKSWPGSAGCRTL